jgi:hypothetical protein
MASGVELARAELRMQLLARNGDGELRDLEIFLTEDRSTCIVFALWSEADDPRPTARFTAIQMIHSTRREF